MTTNAFAADDAAKDKPAAPIENQHKEWTLEDARKHAHEYADKLDKMTPEQWAEHQKKRHEWRDKWHQMTPEEKEAFKKKQHDKREEQKAKMPEAKPAGSGQ
jgi:hypothetical protein